MTTSLLTGNAAAAWGARLAEVDYYPSFPITPQTEIVETLARWVEEGTVPGKLVTLESEHSMLTAAGAAAATGVRVFSATSSQGLLYGLEMLYTVAGWRVPFVLVNVSRGLAAPITLESDHNDVLAARDTGFLQLHCSTCQEVVDSILMAYRLSEDRRVRLPVLVNLDGFYLSFTREPVQLPGKEQAASFVGKFDSGDLKFRASSPMSHAMAVLGGGPYSYFRYEVHLAAQKALGVFSEVAEEFEKTFGRHYEAVEAYCCDDAEFVLVMMGSFATKARDAIDALRAEGWKIGLVRPRLLRPFPEADFYHHLNGKKAIAVIDQNISMGKGGILYTEIVSALFNGARDNKDRVRPLVSSFIGGLGGRDIMAEELFEIASQLKSSVELGEPLPPRLLYTNEEMKELRSLQIQAQSTDVMGGAEHGN